jgi:hypothetical protein
MGRPPRRRYSWGAGAVYAVPADVVAAELERLADQLGHDPNAAEVVEAARDKDSVLHPLLPFNRTQRELAEAFLEKAAADMLRHLKVTFVTPASRTVVLRARVSVPVGGRRAFVPIARVLSNIELRDQLLSDALRDAEVYIKRYAEILHATGADTLADRLIETLQSFLEGR